MINIAETDLSLKKSSEQHPKLILIRQEKSKNLPEIQVMDQSVQVFLYSKKGWGPIKYADVACSIVWMQSQFSALLLGWQDHAEQQGVNGYLKGLKCNEGPNQ